MTDQRISLTMKIWMTTTFHTLTKSTITITTMSSEHRKEQMVRLLMFTDYVASQGCVFGLKFTSDSVPLYCRLFTWKLEEELEARQPTVAAAKLLQHDAG